MMSKPSTYYLFKLLADQHYADRELEMAIGRRPIPVYITDEWQLGQAWRRAIIRDLVDGMVSR